MVKKLENEADLRYAPTQMDADIPTPKSYPCWVVKSELGVALLYPDDFNQSTRERVKEALKGEDYKIREDGAFMLFKNGLAYLSGVSDPQKRLEATKSFARFLEAKSKVTKEDLEKLGYL